MPASAQLRAYHRAEQINSGCNADTGTSPGDILGGLRVGKNGVDPQRPDLTWKASCSGVAIDYSIHEGELGELVHPRGQGVLDRRGAVDDDRAGAR